MSDSQPALETLMRDANGDLVGALHAIQDALGWLPEAALRQVATHLDVPVARVFGVATFYEQLYLEPRGDVIVRVCQGTACHVLGARRITEKLSERLDVKPGGTTPDRRYTLEEVACVGCCSLAPVVVVGDETHGRVTPTGVTELIGDE